MRQPFTIKVLSGLINILTCIVGAVVVLFFQDWFGSRDTYSFIFWTVPLATGLAVSGQTILTLFRTQNRLLRLLLTILTSGAISFVFIYLVYMFLGPWINAFSLPVFQIWIAGTFGQLFFLDRFPPQTKERLTPFKTILRIAAFPLTVIATVICIAAISFAGSYFTKPEPETFLIPDSFEGKARIVYGEKCGINPPVEKGRRVYEIPDNGLLIIQPEFESGIIDHEYFFIDENGKRTKANELEKPSRASLGGSGSFGGLMPDGSISTESPLAIHFSDLYVYKENSKELTDKEYALRDSRIDSLTTALVKECREN